MRVVPRWIVLSAFCAPVFLIGGWTVAAARQPGDYDPSVETISSLAGRGATDRWLMTAALAALGICYLLTALGLRPAAAAGRLVLAVGGVATALVAVFLLPRTGASAAHTVAAGVAFIALAVWPALAGRRGTAVPWALRPAVSIIAAVVLTGLVGWFAFALSRGVEVGLAERFAAGAQSIWPLLVVVTALAHRGGNGDQRGDVDLVR